MLEKYFSYANRASGSWLPNVNNYPDRLKPCGNPRCVDLVMAAIEISGRDYALDTEAGKLLAEATATARQCRANNCPLGKKPTSILYLLYESLAH